MIIALVVVIRNIKIVMENKNHFLTEVFGLLNKETKASSMRFLFYYQKNHYADSPKKYFRLSNNSVPTTRVLKAAQELQC